MKQHAANYSPHGLIYPGIYQPLPDKEREISRQLRRKGGVKLHPASRIFKENGLYRIEVPAPGFSKEDFVVYTNGPLLSINGKRKKLPEPETKNLAEEASMEEAIAYAQVGRGERKRPQTGWASLTPAELNVARLVGEGLPNKDIAARLFVSARTVQAHLSHVYSKLGVTSRVQLAQEASRHA